MRLAVIPNTIPFRPIDMVGMGAAGSRGEAIRSEERPTLASIMAAPWEPRNGLFQLGRGCSGGFKSPQSTSPTARAPPRVPQPRRLSCEQHLSPLWVPMPPARRLARRSVGPLVYPVSAPHNEGLCNAVQDQGVTAQAGRQSCGPPPCRPWPPPHLALDWLPGTRGPAGPGPGCRTRTPVPSPKQPPSALSFAPATRHCREKKIALASPYKQINHSIKSN